MKTPLSHRASGLRPISSAFTAFALALAWLAGPLARPAAAQAVAILPFPDLPNAPAKNFESPQVHPLALTPDGTRLLAVNSPNATLSVFQLTSGSPVLTAEIPVGLEPVSVAARSDREAWVVNWLSDSVSVVDLTTGNVTRTFDVGDEPTDVLFAGSGRELAFVCVSGTAQVKVFDPTADTPALVNTLDVFGKQPRALARDAAGGQVFVSVFESGNQTTLVPQPVVQAQGGLPAPSPALAPGLPPAPTTALIVRWNGSAWADETGNTKWDPFVNYTLADVDLVVIDAAGNTPALSTQVRGLGTHLGNMAFDPAGSRLIVTNIESESVRRFEPNLRGNFQHNRVSVLGVGPGGAVGPAATHDLNQHVDFNNPNGTDAERAESLALPSDLVRASDGTVFVAATSSARVGVLAATGAVTGRIAVGQGPTGLALDEPRSRLYVLNRFDQTLSVVDTNARAQVSQTPVGFNPEPPAVRDGRRFLYDANFSAHGTVSCASCHPAGHRDGLGWDLGDPTGGMVTVRGVQHHPMKGPMTTQSLRGIIGAEPLHWRADRNNLSEFNGAFTGLLGSTRPLTAEEMTAFQNFVRTLTYPPNPLEAPDRTFPDPPTGASPADGARAFNGGGPTLAGLPCNICHTAFTGGRFGIGSDRNLHPGGLLGEPQVFKSPQLRGLYQKTGMQKPAPGQPRAEQPTGFGFMHDGQIDTLFSFLRQPFFLGFQSDQMRRNVEAFLLAFDTGLAPTVGLQVTVHAGNAADPAVLARLQLLTQQTLVANNAGNCDLVVKGVYGGSPRGFVFSPQGGAFLPDSASEAPVTLATLLASVGPGAELTFTGVPFGAGRRFGIDRDADNTLDDDEPRRAVSISGRVVDGAGQPLAGVAVALTGSQRAAATTDALGRYVFQNVSVEGTHTVTPALSGATFTPAERTFQNPAWHQTATFVSAAANASDATTFFVRQHYNDFLGREPDEAGLQHWSNEIEQCGADQQCRQIKRINVSAAFYLAIEFQESGYFAYRTHKAAFGDLPNKPVPITYENLMADSQRLGRNVVVGVGDWFARLQANKAAYAAGFVARPDFLAAFPATMTPTQFVDRLNQNAGNVLDDAARQALITELTNANNSATARASVLRGVADSQALRDREVRRAFVLMQYFGYLRRNPDAVGFDGQPDPTFEGFNFWLGKLNEHDGNFVSAEMVRSFIESIEYRRRFGPS